MLNSFTALIDHIAIAWAPLIASGVTFAIGLLSYRESKRKTKHDELADLYDRLKADNDALRAERDSLRQQVEELRCKTLGLEPKEEKYGE